MALTESAPELLAITPEARTGAGAERIALTTLPFRVGRESRFGLVQGSVVSMERRETEAIPSNELYLRDHEEFLNISREHFQIERRPDGHYEVVDRGSTCGTIVDDVAVGARAKDKRRTLRDGSVIRVGTAASPFLFRFVLHAAPHAP